MIVIVFGLPGSGKSYFAERLARQMNATYIANDRVRTELLEKASYSEKEKEQIYDEVLRRAQSALENGLHVVVDATFYRHALRNQFIHQLKKYGSIVFIEVFAEESTILARLKLPREFSEANEGVYRKVKSQWEPLVDSHLVLESRNDNIEEMLELTTKYLEGK